MQPLARLDRLFAPRVLRLTALGWLLLPLSMGGCTAEIEHDKIFFSCSAQYPTCPEKQVCNLQDQCCHPIDEPPGTPQGQCKLLPDGGTGTQGSGTMPGLPSMGRSSGTQGP